MPKVRTSVGRSSAAQRAMLDHLIAIGEATNQTRWPDDLTNIKGIGPQVAERMARAGITSFSDLANVSGQTKQQLTRGDVFKRFEKRLDGWIQDAAERADQPAAPEADTYLGVVRASAGRWSDAEGTVRRKVTMKSGTARWVSFNIFDAPEGHGQSQKLARSLRAVVEAGVGTGDRVRIPKLLGSHLEELRLMRGTLEGGRTLSKEDFRRLNDVLEGSTLELGDADEYMSVDELMRRAGGAYGAAPDSPPAEAQVSNYERVEVGSTEDPPALRESGRTLYATMVRDDDSDWDSDWDSDEDIPPPPPDSDEEDTGEQDIPAEAPAEEEAP